MSLVALATYSDGFEAEIVAGRLRAGGIEAVVFDGGLTASYGGAFPVRLMVLDEDLAQARALIAAPVETEAVDRGPWGNLAE